jgi:putative CocE/NonD family hydrolase
VPVILVRTPYDNGVAAQVAAGKWWAARGYAYVVQDVRGRGESDGEFYPLVHEAEDGDDTIRWCGAQAWSNGKVGMTGSSYLGWTQLYPAGMKNPSLAALFTIVAPPDPYRNFPMQLGVLSPPTVSWLVNTAGRTLQDISEHDLASVYRRFRSATWTRSWAGISRRGRTVDHPTLDDYWKQRRSRADVERDRAVHTSAGGATTCSSARWRTTSRWPRARRTWRSANVNGCSSVRGATA